MSRRLSINLVCGRISALLVPKKGGQEAQALERSRGGFSSKIHVTVDGLGNPMCVRLTTGQASDIGQAVALVDGLDFD